MKAITLWPEWAHAVAHLGKPIENRDWRYSTALIGERIAIHAGASIGGRKGNVALDEAINAVTMASQDADWEHDWQTDDGYMLTAANLWRGEDSVRIDAFIPTGAIVATAVLGQPLDRRLNRMTVPWGNPDALWWWPLLDVVPLDRPVPAKGKLGLWDFDETLLEAA